MMIPRQFDIWNSKNHKPKILKPKLLFSLKNSRNSARLHLKIWLIHVECDKRYHRSNEKDSASEWNNRQQQQHGHEHYHAFEPVVHDTHCTHTTACTMENVRFSALIVEKGNLPNHTISTINIFIFVQNYK